MENKSQIEEKPLEKEQNLHEKGDESSDIKEHLGNEAGDEIGDKTQGETKSEEKEKNSHEVGDESAENGDLKKLVEVEKLENSNDSEIQGKTI